MPVFLLGLSVLVNLCSSLVAASVLIGLSILCWWIPGWMRAQFSTEEVDCYAASASAKLELYFANGRCKSHAEYWESSCKDYCVLDLLVFALENWVLASRKKIRYENNVFVQTALLKRIWDLIELKVTRLRLPSPFDAYIIGELKQQEQKSIYFSSKSKDISEDPVLSRDSTSLNSLELRSTSGRTPGTPSRVPPSPSRFSLSPQPNKLEPLNLSLNEIIRLTRNFSSAQIIGKGDFATVYKAELHGRQLIAIKRAKKEHIATIQAEFKNEVELLTRIEHRNLVRLLGYTDKGNEFIIITEYVPNGTLREHLDGKYGKILDFSQRLEIAIDVAHGLTYLHDYAEKSIIHRDVKSSNILLTEGFRAKVTDFGFARIGPMEVDETHIQTKVKGTAGYVDPEYMNTCQLTVRSDVYSFGILLLEILSANRPVDIKRAGERITVRWAFNKYKEGNERQILDPQMAEVLEDLVVKKILALAFKCAAPTRKDRPAMQEVVELLWGIRKDYNSRRS